MDETAVMPTYDLDHTSATDDGHPQQQPIRIIISYYYMNIYMYNNSSNSGSFAYNSKSSQKIILWQGIFYSTLLTTKVQSSVIPPQIHK